MLELRHLRHLNSRQLLLLLLLLREEVVVGLVLRRALMWVRIHAGVPPLGAVPFARERRAAPRRRRRRRSHRRGDSPRRVPARALPKPGTLVASLPGQQPLVAAGRIVRGTAPADGPRAEAREQRRRRRPSGAGAARAGAGNPNSQRPSPAKRRREGVRARAALAAEGTEDAAALDRVAAAVASVVVAPHDVARDGLGEALDAAEAAGAVVARVERFPAIAAAGVAAQTGGAARDAVVPVRAAERVSGAVLGCGEEGG
jgi:hypothetical protein